MATRGRLTWSVALGSAIWLAAVGVSLAQIKSGTIVGSVTHTTGALVPDAKVKVISEVTNAAMDVRTDRTGEGQNGYPG